MLGASKGLRELSVNGTKFNLLCVEQEAERGRTCQNEAEGTLQGRGRCRLLLTTRQLKMQPHGRNTVSVIYL